MRNLKKCTIKSTAYAGVTSIRQAIYIFTKKLIKRNHVPSKKNKKNNNKDQSKRTLKRKELTEGLMLIVPLLNETRKPTVNEKKTESLLLSSRSSLRGMNRLEGPPEESDDPNGFSFGSTRSEIKCNSSSSSNSSEGGLSPLSTLPLDPSQFIVNPLCGRTSNELDNSRRDADEESMTYVV